MAKDNIILTVPNMFCDHCAENIKRAVGVLNGVDSINADLKTKKVSVEFDPSRVSVDTLRDTISDQGYDVR